MDDPQRMMTLGAYAPGTLLLIEKLKVGKRGDVLTDADLYDVCQESTAPSSKNEPGSGYGHLLSAVRYVRRHHMLDWVRVHGEGKIKCLGSEETLDHTANTDLRQARRKATRAIQRFGTVDAESLPDARRAELGVRMVQAAMARSSTSHQFQKKLLDCGEVDANKINTKRLIGLFNGKTSSGSESGG